MDGQDEVINKQQLDGGSSSQTIIKGKRTKRQRPQSPIPFRMITPPYPHNNSHSSPTKSDHGSDICSSNNNNNDNKKKKKRHLEENSRNVVEANNFDHDPTLSTATTITTTTTTTTTEEEEAMANCLILLAQGQSRDSIHIPPSPRQQPVLTLLQEQRQHGNNNVGAKFTSRKFMDVTTAGKPGGYYVYECKTCSKTFPSFQALGGHRASHKKPKTAQPNTRNNTMFMNPDDDDPPFKTTSSSSLSLRLTNKALMIYGNGSGAGGRNQHQSRPRVHECSICGAEFSSGQALGGHMRRHRGAVITSAPPPMAAVVADNREPIAVELIKIPTNNTLSLDLDLNLPAPAEDFVDQHHHQQKSEQQTATPSSPQPQKNQQQQQQRHQPQPQQQQQLVFSSLALVDCHY